MEIFLEGYNFLNIVHRFACISSFVGKKNGPLLLYDFLIFLWLLITENTDL